MPDDAADPTEQADLQAGAGGADDENAALIAELEAEQGKAAAAAKKPAPKKPAAKGAPAAEADDEEEADDATAEVEDDAEVEEPDDAAEDDSDDEDLDEDAEATDDDAEGTGELDEGDGKDPALKKRLEAVRRTEQRQRQRLEQDRATLDRERTTFETETRKLRQDVERIRVLAARAKVDPVGLLEAYGLGQDDMEYVANVAYARGKTAAGKPEFRAAAERAQRDREHAEELARTRAELDDVKKGLTEREQQAVADRELDAYFGRAFRKADAAATPITARLIAKRPKAARAELLVTAEKLAAKLGRMPKVGELLAAHERREVRALKLRGITPPAPTVRKPDEAAEADAPAAKPSGKKKPGAKPVVAAENDEDAIPSTADLVRELQSAQRN